MDNIKDLDKYWKYGWTWKGQRRNEQLINYVNNKTVNYIVKYVTKVDPEHKHYKPIILCSKGIGGNYKDTPQAKRWNKCEGS